MPTPEELLKLTPKQIYGKAVNAGIEVAVKRSSIGLKADDGNDPVDKFYQDHPEFLDARVKPLLDTGSVESFQEIMRMVSEIPGHTVVLNHSSHGAKVFEVEPRSDRKKEQKQIKKRHGIFGR